MLGKHKNSTTTQCVIFYEEVVLIAELIQKLKI